MAEACGVVREIHAREAARRIHETFILAFFLARRCSVNAKREAMHKRDDDATDEKSL
jgi:hypothetical protein